MLKNTKKLMLSGIAVLLVAGCADAHMSSGPTFQGYDHDGNGTVSGQEFSSVYTKDDSSAVFKKLDINSDGELAPAEMDQWDMNATAASANSAAPDTKPAVVMNQ